MREGHAKELAPRPDPQLSTVRDIVTYAAVRFKKAKIHFGHGTSNPHDEAAYLVLCALGLPPHELDDHLSRRLKSAERKNALDLIERRITERTPAAYLTGEAWLTGHRFHVDERVIVPRSFIAELLPDGLDLWLHNPERVGSILDLCTGSGCLAILAALAFPLARVDAADLSTDALAVAKRNVSDYRLGRRIDLVESNLFAGLKDGAYDLIISNPPYVDARSMRTLPDEYRKEPELALAGGKGGLDIVHRILHDAPGYLNPHGVLVVEIGHNRAALEAAYPRLAFTWLTVNAGDDFVFLLTREQIAVSSRTLRKSPPKRNPPK